MIRQKSFENEKPTLYLVATPIGNLEEMTYRSIKILNEVDYIAAEDTRNTIKILNHFNIKKKLISHHEHNIQSSSQKIIELLSNGNNIALVSDAGYPAISDPGYELVLKVIETGFNVVSISGANACLNALIVSGICPQPFLFYGFLNHSDKVKKKELDKLSNYEESIIFYESPHRIEKTLKLMLEYFGDRKIALCRELTKKHEEIIRGTISEIIEIVNSIKGEMVIVVEGNPEPKDNTLSFDLPIIDQINLYINEGLSSKEAIKKVAKERQIPKNEVYKIYHIDERQ